MQLDIIRLREFWRMALCSLTVNLYISAQATMGLSLLMMPHLRATIDRQASKVNTMVEVRPGDEDGYPAQLPPEQRAVALSGELRGHISNAAELCHLMYLWESNRMHKVEARRFNKMQGYEDRVLPIPRLYEVLW
ncbi:hypothetical protein C2E21_8737 [Chlorella sorokiniana]|uniref:Uncharacterized protein n=1 Tax=Chlorella sorokiniana TaxID=3076 RepID=A0A2P6TDG6_CHLSO|nr:hypothetical protein C2E21_8737 [Chlorella sorokiniana]|eukprot:PRW20675.1 hypothetical protein C2E21_8737 [Chlorella sorokiniana]